MEMGGRLPARIDRLRGRVCCEEGKQHRGISLAADESLPDIEVMAPRRDCSRKHSRR